MSDALASFQAVRPRLFGIAYRMLGTVAEAEDVVQDAWLRWDRADRDRVDDPAAFLATTVTRLAITALTSARARRERYVGPWLPEPVLTTDDDPLLGAERGEALSLAVLLLLERLTPAERAAFVLREAFAYSHREVAAVLETSEANARQLASRGRAHLDRERGAAVEVDRGEHRRLLGAVLAAAGGGDLAALESLLARDVVVYSDGGGVVLAARKPSSGAERSAVFLAGVAAKFTDGVRMVPVFVNGAPGFVGVRDGAVMSVGSIEVGADGIRQVQLVLNPAKLRGVAATV